MAEIINLQEYREKKEKGIPIIKGFKELGPWTGKIEKFEYVPYAVLPQDMFERFNTKEED